MIGKNLHRDDASVIAVFFVQAFASGSLLTRVPDLQTHANLTEAELGFVFTVASIGGIISTLYAGKWIQRFGTKSSNLLGIVGLALVPIAAALATGVGVMAVIFFLSGLVFGVTNVAMNLEADRQEAATGRRIMNLCHGFWSVGVLFATVLGVGARAIPVSPFWHFTILFPLVVVAVLALANVLAEAPRRAKSSPKSNLAWPDKVTLVLVLFGLSATTAHAAANIWSVIFARDLFVAADWVDTLTLPAFLLAMTLSRLFADGWVDRFGPVLTARGLILVSAIGTVAICSSPNVLIACLGFAMVGFGTGPIFPLMVSAAARYTNRPAEDAVAAVILLISATMIFMPVVMGWLVEAAGLRLMFAATLPLFALTFWISPKQNP